MSTSGTASWNPDMTEIIEEAFERCGVEVRTGYQFRTARRSLNLLFQEWANKGLNLWTVEQGQISLTAGTVQYNLPEDTVDIIEHVIRQNPGSTANQVDLQIARVALPTYASIPNKLATGRPIQIYVDRVSPIPHVKIWPTASDNSYTLVYWRLRRIQDAGQSGSNTMDVPFRFTPALIAGLAYYLALKTPEAMDRIAALKELYDEAYDLAAQEDRDRAPVRFIPHIGYVGGRGW